MFINNSCKSNSPNVPKSDVGLKQYVVSLGRTIGPNEACIFHIEAISPIAKGHGWGLLDPLWLISPLGTFPTCKVFVKLFESSSYLTGVVAAKLSITNLSKRYASSQCFDNPLKHHDYWTDNIELPPPLGENGGLVADNVQEHFRVWNMWLFFTPETSIRFDNGSTWLGHDDVIKLKHFPRYWPFVRGIHRLPVNSLHKGQWRGALMFSLICVWTNSWVNNREAGDLRRHRVHYDVIVMRTQAISWANDNLVPRRIFASLGALTRWL